MRFAPLLLATALSLASHAAAAPSEDHLIVAPGAALPLPQPTSAATLAADKEVLIVAPPPRRKRIPWRAPHAPRDTTPDADTKCSLMCGQILPVLDQYCSSTGSTSSKCQKNVCPTVTFALLSTCADCYNSSDETTDKKTQALAAYGAMQDTCAAYVGGNTQQASTLNPALATMAVGSGTGVSQVQADSAAASSQNSVKTSAAGRSSRSSVGVAVVGGVVLVSSILSV